MTLEQIHQLESRTLREQTQRAIRPLSPKCSPCRSSTSMPQGLSEKQSFGPGCCVAALKVSWLKDIFSGFEHHVLKGSYRSQEAGGRVYWASGHGKVPQTGGLQQQKLLVSQLRRLEV